MRVTYCPKQNSMHVSVRWMSRELLHHTDYLPLPPLLSPSPSRSRAVWANLLFPFSFSLPLSIDQQIPARSLAHASLLPVSVRLSLDVRTTYTLLGECSMILTRPQPSEGRFNADEVLVVSVQRCEMVDECFEAVVSLLTLESGF